MHSINLNFHMGPDASAGMVETKARQMLDKYFLSPYSLDISVEMMMKITPVGEEATALHVTVTGFLLFDEEK